MSNQVYANGREVSCKAASGQAVAAFPDICLSPPSPPAGPVPIPYPNTAKAADTTDGSKTVQISGKEVMLKDSSYFNTSTGDEAATRSLGMGVVSHTIQGKAYFTSWSMDVMVEGENVVRHLDLTTHNHNPAPGNSPPWLYRDEAATGKTDECKEVRQAVESACKDKRSFNAAGPPPKGKCSKECCDAKKCVLAPYGKVPKCCDGKTKHHTIPDHCFKQPGAGGYHQGINNMSYSEGLAICVTGKDKDDKAPNGQLLEHGKIHRDFDRIENDYRDNRGGKWSFDTANEAASDVCAFHTTCKKECIQQQNEQYYKGKNTTKITLRADADAGTQPSPTELGDPQANWLKRHD